MLGAWTSLEPDVLKPSLFACLLGLAAGGSLAEPAPLNPVLFAFPGAGIAPSSARSAGLALADRWLGDQPFDNPAASPGRQALVSPVLQRVSRQDLRAANRHFDEQTGFFDAGGAWASVPVGRLSLGLYAFQPVRRLEDNAFERGERGAPVEPAVIQTRATSREVRTGLAASLGLGWRHLGSLRRESGVPRDRERGRANPAAVAGPRRNERRRRELVPRRRVPRRARSLGGALRRGRGAPERGPRVERRPGGARIRLEARGHEPRPGSDAAEHRTRQQPDLVRRPSRGVGRLRVLMAGGERGGKAREGKGV